MSYIKLEKITPAYAEQLLKNSIKNRALYHRHINFLAKQIINGQWQLNGETIKISRSGKLLDGQHRLNAVIESNTSIECYVMYEIDEEVFKTIDTGKHRTGRDVIAIEYGYSGMWSQILTGAYQWVRLYEINSKRPVGKISNAELLHYLKTNEEILNSLEFVRNFFGEKKGGVITKSMSVFIHFETSQLNKGLSEEFLQKLNLGINLTNFDPIFYLRNILLRNIAGMKKYKEINKLLMCIKVWNSIRRNKIIKEPNIYIKAEEYDRPGIPRFI